MRLVMVLKSLLLLLLLLFGPVCPAFALDFNAFWLYETSGGEGRETSKELQERYTLGVGPHLTYAPTHALTGAFTVGYTRTQQDRGRGMATESQITPSASLTLRNDIFLAQLAGSASRNRTATANDEISRSWDAALASRWEIPLWPTLRFNYGQRSDEFGSGEFSSGESGSGGDLFAFSDDVQTYRSLSVFWDLLLAQLDYRFSSNLTENHHSGSVAESKSHFARVVTGGRLLQNRVTYDLSQQAQETTSAFTIGRLDADGFFPQIIEGESRMKVDTIVDPAPNEIGYIDPALVVGATPVEVSPGERLHLYSGNKFGFSQQVDVVYIRVEQFGAEAAELQWALFLRDFSGVGWTQVPGNIQGEFDPLSGYIVLPVNQLANEILLVAVNNLGAPLTLTDLRAFTLLTGSGGGTSRSYLTSAGVQIKLTKTLSASSNIIRERLESFSAETHAETTRSSLNGQLRWAPRSWVIPTLGYSENREDSSGAEVQLNRSYSLIVATIPLPTMHVSFGTTRSEFYSGEQKTGNDIRYNVTTTASIYPDLNSSLNLVWQESERLVSSDDAAGNDVVWEDFALSKNFSSRFNLNAQLQRNLVADLALNYRTSKAEVFTSENADATLNLRYRPSDFLVVRAVYTVFLLNSTQPSTFGAGFTLALLRSTKTRLDLNYSIDQATETSHRLGLDGSWYINRSLYLQSQANYSIQDTNTYSLRFTLNYRI